MGGNWSAVFATRPERASELEGELQRRLDALESQFSTYRPDSDVSRFNRGTSDGWFPVAPDVARVVDESLRISADTGGTFDVTVAPLVDLWGFGAGSDPKKFGERPSAEAVAGAKRRVDYRLLQARPTPPALRKLKPDLAIELGGIGQGYAADRLAEHLVRAGVDNFLVDVCGELRASGLSGRSPYQSRWRVGIELPQPEMRRIIQTAHLTDMSIATSGDYRQFFVDRDGRRYSHEIDPRTGEPVHHALASVSVADPSAARADALATALMVMGPDDGLRFARERDLAAMFIVRINARFEVRTTPSFDPLLVPDELPKGCATGDVSGSGPSHRRQ